MAQRIKCQSDTKIIYNYLNGKPKKTLDAEFNYPADWPENYADDGGKLYGVKASILFSLAIALGYKNNQKKEFNSGIEIANKDSFPKYLMPIINAIAIYDSEEGLDILMKECPELRINAEEYANGGITILNSLYQKNMDGIINDFHLEIKQIIEEKDILNRIEKL